MIVAVVGLGKKSATRHFEAIEVHVIGCGADHPTVNGFVEPADLFFDLTNRQRFFDRRNSGHQTLEIVVLQAIVEDPARATTGGLGFVGWFDRAVDDVGDTKHLEPFLSIAARAFADGKHGDHAGDAEDDAQDGQA